MYLNLGVCVCLKDYYITRIDGVNFDSTIDEFKLKVAERVNVLKEHIDLVFGGLVLPDSSTLKQHGLQPGFVLHVLPKHEKQPASPPPPIPESDFQDLVQVFRALSTRNAYRRVLQKLHKPEVLENIISTTPGLADDYKAIVILQHPELLAKLGDANAVKRVIEEHPSLANAARNLVAAVQNDMLTSPAVSTSASVNNAHNVAFATGSDDDEMEGLVSGDQSQNNEDGERPVNVITSSQVAAALANTSALRAVNRNSSSSGITHEMMSAALQQAIASTSSGSAAPSENESVPESTVTMAKLEELRRLGFSNDAVNIQALQLANGELESAVNLLLSGFMNENE